MAERLRAAIKAVQALVADLRAACEEVGSGAARAKREVDASRQGLKGALRWARAWGRSARHSGCCPGCCAESSGTRPARQQAAVVAPPTNVAGPPVCGVPRRAHQEAVAAAAAAAAARARPGGRGRAVEADPWLTEGRLVEQQVSQAVACYDPCAGAAAACLARAARRKPSWPP